MKRETRVLGFLAAAVAGALFLLRKKKPAPAVVQEEVLEEDFLEGLDVKRGEYRGWTWRLLRGEKVEGKPHRWMTHIGAPGVDIDETPSGPGGAEYLGHYTLPTMAITAARKAIDEKLAPEPGVHGSYRKWHFALREHQVGEFTAWGVWVGSTQEPIPNPFLYVPTEELPEEFFVDNAGTPAEAKELMKAHIEAFPVGFKEELQP